MKWTECSEDFKLANFDTFGFFRRLSSASVVTSSSLVDHPMGTNESPENKTEQMRIIMVHHKQQRSRGGSLTKMSKVTGEEGKTVDLSAPSGSN